MGLRHYNRHPPDPVIFKMRDLTTQQEEYILEQGRERDYEEKENELF